MASVDDDSKGDAQTGVWLIAQTGMWLRAGPDDGTVRTLLQEYLNLPLSPADSRTSRYLLIDFCVYNDIHDICCVRLTWNVVTFPSKPGPPARAPAPQTLEREGAQIQLPTDPLNNPIFCTLASLGEVVPPHPILVIVQFYERPGATRPGPREIAVIVNAQSLQPTEVACTSKYVPLQTEQMDAEYSDDEEIADGRAQHELLRHGFLVDTGSSDEESVDDDEEDGA